MLSEVKETRETITVDNFIDDEIFNLIKSASDDFTRYHLMTVMLDTDKGQAYSTNNHTMAVIDFEFPDEIKNTGRYLIPVEHLKEMKRVKKKDRFGARLTFSNRRIDIEYLGGKSLGFETLEPETYPDVFAIFKEKNTPKYRISLNPELLRDLANAIGQNGKIGNIGVELVFGAPTEAIQVNVRGEMKGMLMPMRDV